MNGSRCERQIVSMGRKLKGRTSVKGKAGRESKGRGDGRKGEQGENRRREK